MNFLYSEQPLKRPTIRENLLISDVNGVPHETTNIIKMLGWAAQKGIPFHEAVAAATHVKATFTPSRNATASSGKSYLIIDFKGIRRGTVEDPPPPKGTIEFSKISDDGKERKYYRRKPKTLDEKIACVAEDLKEGQCLSDALEKRLSRDFPPYLIDAVREAERGGQLATALPALASSLNFTSNVNVMRGEALSFSCAYVLVILFFATFIFTFILPKFDKIITELCWVKMPFMLPTSVMFHACDVNIEHLLSKAFMGCGIILVVAMLYYYLIASSLLLSAWLLLWVLLSRGGPPTILTILYVLVTLGLVVTLCLSIWRLLKTFGPVSWLRKNLMIGILSKIPFLGASARRVAMFEFGGCMASFLKAGKDMPDALEMSARATSHEWLRWPVAEIAMKVKNGEEWLRAWEASKIGSPFQNWLLRSAAANNDVADGFARIAEISRGEIVRTTKVHIMLIEFAALAFNACVVGFLYLGIGLGLCSMMKAIMGGI